MRTDVHRSEEKEVTPAKTSTMSKQPPRRSEDLHELLFKQSEQVCESFLICYFKQELP